MVSSRAGQLAYPRSWDTNPGKQDPSALCEDVLQAHCRQSGSILPTTMPYGWYDEPDDRDRDQLGSQAM